jgi:hypothetical protein
MGKTLARPLLDAGAIFPVIFFLLPECAPQSRAALNGDNREVSPEGLSRNAAAVERKGGVCAHAACAYGDESDRAQRGASWMMNYEDT